MAVPQKQDVENYINQLNIRLNKVIQNQIKINKQKLTEIKSRYIFKNPISIYQAKELIFDSLLDRLKFSTINITNIKQKQFEKLKENYILKNPSKLIESKTNKYLQLISKLETLSPLLTLKRGYTITKKENKAITTIKDISKGDKINIDFQDGTIISEVIEKCKN